MHMLIPVLNHLKYSIILNILVRKYSCDKKVQHFKLVCIRHGQSEWNNKNMFTGWYDAKLTFRGIKEAENSGAVLKSRKYVFDIAYTSVLTRAIDSLNIVLKNIDQVSLPVMKSWRLNERHYGALTGLNKAETASKYGVAQVKLWRRSYDIPPPPMNKDHPYYSLIVNDPRYAAGPQIEQFPMTESLKMTLERVLPYWTGIIVPQIKLKKKVLIVSHGNSLRAMIKFIEDISDADIVSCYVPTGLPFMYMLNENMKPLDGYVRKYLGDQETIKAALSHAAKMAKVKGKENI